MPSVLKLTTPILAVAILTAGCLGGGAPSTTETGSMTTPDQSELVAITDDHKAALEAAGSYTATWELRSGEAGEAARSQTRHTALVDYHNERYLISQGVGSASESQGGSILFYADGRSYRQVGPPENPSYGVQPAAFNPSIQATLRPMVPSSGDLSAFEYTGTTSYDGVTVKRYVLTERTPWLLAQSQLDEEFRIGEFDYELMVDGDGLVRYERWHVMGTQAGVERTVTFEYTLTDVGSTTVADPDWLAAAMAQNG